MMRILKLESGEIDQLTHALVWDSSLRVDKTILFQIKWEKMADKPVAAAVSNPQQGQGVIKRFFELLMMLVSMFLVMFAWGEVSEAWVAKLGKAKQNQTKPSQMKVEHAT